MLVAGVVGAWAIAQLREPPPTRAIRKLPPVVEWISVERGPDVLSLQAEGEVVPFRELTLAAQVAGRISHRAEECRAGRFVEKGTTLVKIDDRDYQLDADRIRQSISQAEASIEELDVQRSNEELVLSLAKQDLELAQRDKKRTEDLYARRAASQSVLDTAERAVVAARSNVQISENRLRVLLAQRRRVLHEKDRLLVDLDKALLSLERTVLRAPTDGIIAEVAVETDDYVTPGETLVRMDEMEDVEVRFDLTLDQLRWIWDSSGQASSGGESDAAETIGRQSFLLPRLAARVSAEIDGVRYLWPAELTRYDGNGLDATTRTVPCIVRVPEPFTARRAETEDSPLSRGRPQTLLRGMYVQVSVDVPMHRPTLRVPAIAYRPGDRVWVYDNGKLSLRSIRVAQTLADEVLVLPEASELVEGDRLITSPLSIAVHGMEVRPADAADGRPRRPETLPAAHEAAVRRENIDGAIQE